MRTHHAGKRFMHRRIKHTRHVAQEPKFVVEAESTVGSESPLVGGAIGRLAKQLGSINLKTHKKNIRRKYIF